MKSNGEKIEINEGSSNENTPPVLESKGWVNLCVLRWVGYTMKPCLSKYFV